MNKDERLAVNLRLTKKETNQVKQIAERLHISVEAAAKICVLITVKVVDPTQVNLLTTDATMKALRLK